jgi:tRNA (guanine37-N1)-methyltransferase
VLDDAATRLQVRELSLGDYVLNGGEVAALAMVEAVVRLLPGFMGNAESLAEESHADGLLEYPVYTKPASWRGHAVPEVLLSGDHARIAQWRRAQSVRRTAERRPDLAHPARLVEAGDIVGVLGAAEIRAAGPADPGELLTLQRACWSAAAGTAVIREELPEVEASLEEWTTLVLRAGGRLVGAGRGRRTDGHWEVGRVMVAPDLQGHGVGRLLLEAVEGAAPDDVTGYTAVVAADEERALRLFRRAGYRPRGRTDASGATVLTRRRRRS